MIAQRDTTPFGVSNSSLIDLTSNFRQARERRPNSKQ
jgi:hypothetical protein